MSTDLDNLKDESIKFFKLKNRSDFLSVRYTGNSVFSKNLIMQYRECDRKSGLLGVGFTATKKIGKANVRNRAKRRLRVALSLYLSKIKSEYDIVLIARTSTPTCPWDRLLHDLDMMIGKAKLYK